MHYPQAEQVCPQCKRRFEPTCGVRQVYCNGACKQAAYRQRHHIRAWRPRRREAAPREALDRPWRVAPPH
jgi:hypothetical protein